MSGSDVHVFLVAALDATTNSWGRFISNSSGTDWGNASRPMLILKNSATAQIADRTTSNVAQSDGNEIDGVTKLIRSSVEAGTAKIAINGTVQTTTGAVTTPLTGPGLSVGLGNSNVVSKMTVKEIVYVRGAMTAQEITDTENYLTTKHGL